MPSQVIELDARTIPRVESLQATLLAIMFSSPSQFLSLFLTETLCKNLVRTRLI